MEKQTSQLKRVQFWNMILLIFGAIGSAMGIAELPTIFNPATIDRTYPTLSNVTDPNVIKTVEKSMTILKNPFYQGYSILMLMMGLTLVAVFFHNHRRLAQRKMVRVWPYYLQLVKLLTAVVVSFLTGSALISSSLTLLTLALNIAWALPAVICVLILRKN